MSTTETTQEAVPPDDADGSGGYWACIAFMGHNEYAGYVTEIVKNGQPAYRVDLPEKLWGGNPLSYVEYAATAWFSDHPVTEESVRRQWEAKVRAAAERARQEAEWQQREQRLELAAGVRVETGGFDLAGAYEGDYGDDDD